MAKFSTRIAHWHTDKLIGLGLIIALLLKICGDIAISIITGNTPPSDLPMNIVTGLVGYMGRSLVEKARKIDDEEEGAINDNQYHRDELTTEKRKGT